MYSYFIYSNKLGNIAMLTSREEAISYQTMWSSLYPEDTTEIKLERRW